MNDGGEMSEMNVDSKWVGNQKEFTQVESSSMEYLTNVSQSMQRRMQSIYLSSYLDTPKRRRLEYMLCCL